MQFIKLTERNEWEGETWRFYLQVDGNEEQITKLRRLLSAAAKRSKIGLDYTLDDTLMSEADVDALVDNCDDDGYMPAHNKVVGRFVCPDDLGERANELYKGSIEEFFTAVEASDA
jgi:hypothetical protein